LKKTLLITLALLLAVGAGIVIDRTLLPGSAGPGAPDEQRVFLCPMHPDVVREGPADCPICGMDLVPAEPEQASASARGAGDDPEPDTVSIAPEVANNLGVRTSAAERRELRRRVVTVGYVEYDRTRFREIYSPAQGQIENLSVRSEGERVKKGQYLFQVLAPMLGASYDKTYAAQDGVIVTLEVIEGSYVSATSLVLTMADLASVWVLADVFEHHAAWVRVGQEAEVRLPYLPDRVWKGKVEYVYPNLDPETRTLKVRMRFDNPDEVLKPNMHTEVTILGKSRADVLAIPRDAVIVAGGEHRVILALDEGRFRPAPVAVGAETDEVVEILEGIEEGDRVVTSAQFLIDSEASLRASLSRMRSGDESEDRD
jgi:Cu(I)/Ag(I) efflux system membrane fusion protein